MAVSSSIVFSKNYAIPLDGTPSNMLHSFARSHHLIALTIDRVTSLWNILTKEKLWSLQQSYDIPPQLLLDKTGLVVQVFNYECEVLFEGALKAIIRLDGKFTQFKIMNGEIYGFGSIGVDPCICHWNKEGALIQKVLASSLNGDSRELLFECDDHYFVICGNDKRAHLAESSSFVTRDRRTSQITERFLNLKTIGSISILGEQLILGVHQKAQIGRAPGHFVVHKNPEIMIMNLVTGQFINTITFEGLYSSIVHTFGFQNKLFFVSVVSSVDKAGVWRDLNAYRARSRLLIHEKPKGIFEEIPEANVENPGCCRGIEKGLNLSCTAKLSSINLLSGEIRTILSLGVASNFVSSVFQNSYNLCYRVHDDNNQVKSLTVDLATSEIQENLGRTVNETGEWSCQEGILVLKQLDSTGMYAYIKDYNDTDL